MPDRRQESYAVRLEAAELARSRVHPTHQANGDEQRYAGDKYFMSFTKGLPHNLHTGLLEDPNDFVEFRRAIDDGFIDPFSVVRHGAKYEVVPAGNEYTVQSVPCPPNDFRQWEAPTAGVVFDLQGPDAQAVTMPPAPPLMISDTKANPELILEMAEVYELAILRDVELNYFEKESTATNQGALNPDFRKAVGASIARLNELAYIKNYQPMCCEWPGRPRKVDDKGELTVQTVFRGSSPGVEVGPYLSQFLLIGNPGQNGGGSVADGKIVYGALEVDQKVSVAKPREDYMTDMVSYVEMQRGLKPEPENYEPDPPGDGSPRPRPNRRFISTPRDLATYVHYDALYEAYLNACIILLGMGTPFDPAFDHLSGGGAAAGNPEKRRHVGGFALYGGPHILNLVTEVATRALKAVRFQKFNNHIRLRPEALAARIELLRRNELPSSDSNHVSDGKIPLALKSDIKGLKERLQRTLDVIKNGPGKDTYFLPMAFPEGSPMHPAYGAGHATVAGACVTVLKAFFDTSAVLVATPVKDPETGKPVLIPSSNDIKREAKFKRYSSQSEDCPGDIAIAFRAPELPAPSTNQVIPPKVDLDSYTPSQPLTLEGELNKLAANISIGRNMAGVHFFTDYYDSLRMGEKIALGILEEQALAYSTDPFVLSLPTFDGDVVRIGHR
ncbi:MAG: bromoperoxidase [Cyanobacteria bacterium P01_G01_bin.38]